MQTKTMLRVLLLAGTVLYALPSAVFAQSASSQTDDSSDAAQAAKSPAAQGTSEQGAEIGEILVTATRRTERLQDVPISISVASAQLLERASITNIKELSQVTSGLNFAYKGATFAPAIRGLSSEGGTPGNESNVALYIDGVYRTQQYANIFDLSDIERIEVLKGPQGTLFGRNATAGAISVITKVPSFTPVADVTLTGGRHEDGGNIGWVKAYVSAPVAQKIAVNFSAAVGYDEGYFHDILRNDRGGRISSQTYRGKVLFQATDDLDITGTAYYSKRKDYSQFSTRAITPFAGALALPSRFDVADSARGFVDAETYGGSLKAEQRFDAGTLSFLGSYDEAHVCLAADADGSSLPLLVYVLCQPAKTHQLEATFASKKFGRLSFVGGLFDFKNDERYRPLNLSAFIDGPFFYTSTSTSLTFARAAFGEANFDLTDKLTVIGGVRYSHEKRQASAGPGGGAPESRLGEVQFGSWTPRVSVRYAFSPEANVYFTYSEGFKSGLFNTGILGAVELIKPEKLRAYEIGSKVQISNRVRLSAAAFYYDEKNIQVNVNTQQGLALVSNAATARVIGFDLESDYRLTPDFSLGVNLEYLPTAKFLSFPNASVIVPDYVNGGGRSTTLDLSGHRLPKAARLQGNVSLNYDHAYQAGVLQASLNVAYTTAYTIELSESLRQKAYANINPSVDFTPTNSKMTYGIYAKNLANERTLSNYLTGGAGVTYTEGPPLEYGFKIAYKY